MHRSMHVATMAPRASTTATSLLATVTASADAAASPSSPKPPPPPPCAAPWSAVAFLRARCATTRFRVRCYDALVPYGCMFGTSQVKLARAAADVDAATLRAFSARVKEIVARGGGGGGSGEPAVPALGDCKSTVSSAARLAKDSAAELAWLDSAGDAVTVSQVRWAVSNAQTWLSAAMANVAICSDGLGALGAAASPAAKELVAGAVTAMQHRSVALELVNGIPR